MNLTGYLGLALGVALLSLWLAVSHGQAVQREYDLFKGTQEALAAKQKSENLVKEKENAEKIRSAESARDAALVRLREHEKRSSADRLSVTPKPAEGADKICFSRSRLDEAIQRLLADVQELLGEGDRAIIDNRAWLEAWPR